MKNYIYIDGTRTEIDKLTLGRLSKLMERKRDYEFSVGSLALYFLAHGALKEIREL